MLFLYVVYFITRLSVITGRSKKESYPRHLFLYGGLAGGAKIKPEIDRSSYLIFQPFHMARDILTSFSHAWQIVCMYCTCKTCNGYYFFLLRTVRSFGTYIGSTIIYFYYHGAFPSVCFTNPSHALRCGIYTELLLKDCGYCKFW